MADGSHPQRQPARNVLGGLLAECSREPMTGFFRDGCCHTRADDFGMHTVCAVMTDDFLEFSKAAGNDLSTPRSEYQFPGLNAGDRWCLCAPRWVEAHQAGKAPKLILTATHEATLSLVSLEVLKRYAHQPTD